jgi:branched-chain amino acid transport system substrate-binding protein
MLKTPLVAAALALATAFSVQAADRVKVGLVTTLSGPNAAPGIEVRDGFNLAVKLAGGKLGGLKAEVLVTDDQFNPEIGKQAADKNLRRDRVDVMTGIIYSNILLAVAPDVFNAKIPYVSANAGPSQYAGEQCNPYFSSAAWQNDGYHEAAGKYASDKGFKSVYLIAPNYQAGKDALAGFKRMYKGKVVDEVYVRLGQLDYAAEMAQVRAAKPDAVYTFMPGGMGINFVKQYVAAGLSRDIQLVVPGFSADEDVIKSVGDQMVGLFNTAHWNHDFDNPASRRFVDAFEREFGRLPSAYAAQGYDAALMIDAAVTAVKGRVENREAFAKALRSVKFASVRGDFKLNTNGYPIQNYYLRVIGKDAKGRVTNKTIGTIFTNHGDAYVGSCKLK